MGLNLLFNNFGNVVITHRPNPDVDISLMEIHFILIIEVLDFYVSFMLF